MQGIIVVYSRREAADALRVSLRTIDSLLARGQLISKRIGRRVLIPETEIQKLLQQDTPIADRALQVSRAS